MMALFNTEKKALEFMIFLNEKNNQGHKNVMYQPTSHNNVQYTFNDHVIHDDIYEDVRTFLKK